MKRALEGVKVVELGVYAAAPWTGKLLADMGAEVIKIEAPGGDPQRKFGESANTICEPDENPCYQYYNGGKKSICLNLKSEEGKEVLYGLLKEANIFFTNTRMGALKRMGLSYEDLKDKFPHLIYGHVSGYGLEGPDAELPGFDSSAFFARSGYLLDSPYDGYGPLSLTYGLGDNTTAAYMAVGLLAALHKQQVTGEGDFVLVSLYGCAISTEGLMVISQNEGEGYNEKWPQDRMMPMTPVCATYLTKDKSAISLALLSHEKFWPGFCKAMGLEELTEDPRYCTREECKKPENSRAMVTMLTDLFMTQDASYWAERLSANDCPYSVPQHIKDVHHDVQAWDNNYLTKFTFKNGHTSNIPNIPVQFKGNVAVPMVPAHDVGEDTKDILKEIGYDDKKIESLYAANVVH